MPIMMTLWASPGTRKTGDITCLPEESAEPVVRYLEQKLTWGWYTQGQRLKFEEERGVLLHHGGHPKFIELLVHKTRRSSVQIRPCNPSKHLMFPSETHAYL
jgi:hypothetical protein